jgi:hypothetical protein
MRCYCGRYTAEGPADAGKQLLELVVDVLFNRLSDFVWSPSVGRVDQLHHAEEYPHFFEHAQCDLGLMIR